MLPSGTLTTYQPASSSSLYLYSSFYRSTSPSTVVSGPGPEASTA